MRIPHGAADWSQARRQGRFVDDLLSNHDWVLRRVDTVSLIDGERIERRVTLDIDVPDLRRRAKEFGLPMAFVPLPLLVLGKGPLLDVDIKDVHGDSVAIATSDQDSHLASAMLLAILDRHGVAVGRLPPTVLWQIYSIVRDEVQDRLEKVLYAASPDSFDIAPELSDAAPPVRLSDVERAQWIKLLGKNADLDKFITDLYAHALELTATDLSAWNEILDVEEFLDGLIDFADTFMLVGQLDVRQDGEVAIVKVRLVEGRSAEDEQSSWFSLDRLGWRPQLQKIPMSGLGRAQRNHVRVLAPGDSVVRSATWTKDDELVHRVRDGLDDDSKPAPLDRAVFYKSGLKPAAYEVQVELEPSRASFLVPAALTTGLLMVLLGSASVLQWMDARFTEVSPGFVARPGSGMEWLVDSTQVVQANFDAAVTVLAIVPSLVAIYIVRAGEHRLVTRLMTLPRWLVLASAFSAILCAGATAASVQPGTLWGIYATATVITMVAFVAVMIPIVRVSAFRRRRWKSSHAP